MQRGNIPLQKIQLDASKAILSLNQGRLDILRALWIRERCIEAIRGFLLRAVNGTEVSGLPYQAFMTLLQAEKRITQEVEDYIIHALGW